jgi:hypothetical protein
MDREFLIKRLRSLEDGKKREQQVASQAAKNLQIYSCSIQEITFLLQMVDDTTKKDKEYGQSMDSASY